ncbi:hypothetical protein ACFPRL_32790 [Pseudoclavibacter helvolus]
MTGSGDGWMHGSTVAAGAVVYVLRDQSRSTARAACIPGMPWTPPPGGVEEEHTYSPRRPARYGWSVGAGLNSCCVPASVPPPMSPPTRLGFHVSSALGDHSRRSRMTSPKPGAKRSICASSRGRTSCAVPFGTCA